MRRDNSHHLVAAAQRRRADTLQRARQALHELDETGQRRTVTQIAAHAGVSRSWLYAQPELRDQLRRLTAISEPTESAPARVERGSDASLRQRFTLAHERIRELDDENRKLRNQIALLHGQLRANRITGTHVTDTVHDINPQLTPPKSRSGPR
jgi:small-conductance mechanosensitive channel